MKPKFMKTWQDAEFPWFFVREVSRFNSRRLHHFLESEPAFSVAAPPPGLLLYPAHNRANSKVFPEAADCRLPLHVRT